MTTATLTPGQARNCVFVRNLGEPSKMYTKQVYVKDTGNTTEALIIEGKPIFRSGTFSDSMGIEHEWEALHMTQMVDHAQLLSSRELFQDVPIRKGHPDWGGLFSDPVRNAMDELVGYMSNFRTEERKNPTDSVTYTYLLADFEILEETAKKNIQSGLWRNVSAEISTYRTNGNAEYWPVMFGCAYVDIPAVEGLKSQHSTAFNKFSIILEDDMSGENPTPGAPGTKPERQQFTINGKATSDYSAVQAHITNVEAENGTLKSENEGLKQFQRETQESAREDFVKALAVANKIPATQEEGYIAYAKGLDAEQWSGWKALMDAAPALKPLGVHGAGFSQNHQQVGEQQDADAKLENLKAVVSNHKMSGKSDDVIKKMPSYKELIVLDPSYTIPA